MASRPFVDLPFLEYAPDYGGMPRADDPAYLTDIIGLRYTPNGYRGEPSFSDVASAAVITGSSASLWFMKYAQGTTSGFPAGLNNFFAVNNAGSIYISQSEGTSWTDVTPTSTAPKSASRLFQFGQYAIGACGNRTIYKDLSGLISTAFVTLTGAPIAWKGARIRDHAVLMVLSTNAFALQWSAIGDPTSWPTPGTSASLAAQAGTQTLNTEFGLPLHIIGGEKFGLIFQESSITRMTYVGGSDVFEFDTFEKKYGLGQNSTGYPIYAEGVWYWYTDKGMFATDGYTCRKIPGKVDEALFLKTISHPLQSFVGSSNSGGFDPGRRRVLWNVNGYTASAQYLLTLSLHDMSIGIFTDTTPQNLVNGVSGSTSFNPEYIYNINGSNMKLANLRGASGSIALQTGYIELDPGYKVQLTGAHLLGAGVPGSLTLAYKSTSSLGSVDVSQSGFTNLTAAPRGMKATGRSTEQFHAFRVTGTGAESQLIRGIRVYFERGEPAT